MLLLPSEMSKVTLDLCHPAAVSVREQRLHTLASSWYIWEQIRGGTQYIHNVIKSCWMWISISVTRESTHQSQHFYYHLWEEKIMMNVIKCPSTSSPQGDINNNPYPNLKHNPIQTLALRLQPGRLHLGLASLRDVCQYWAFILLRAFLNITASLQRNWFWFGSSVKKILWCYVLNNRFSKSKLSRKAVKR